MDAIREPHPLKVNLELLKLLRRSIARVALVDSLKHKPYGKVVAVVLVEKDIATSRSSHRKVIYQLFLI